MKKITLFILANFISISLSAQNKPYVYVGGTISGLSSHWNSLNKSEDFSLGGGFNVGCGLDISLEQDLIFYLSPALQLTENHFTSKNAGIKTGSFNLWNLQLPVFLTYRTKNLSRHFSLEFGVGPYVGLKLGDKHADTVKSFDAGCAAKIGAIINDHYSISIEDYAGMVNLAKDGNEKYKRTMLSLTLGYKF